MKRSAEAVWGCDDVNEGTLHNGVGDARVHGLVGQMQTDEQTADCIASLEQKQQSEKSQESGASTSAATAREGSASSLAQTFASLQHFVLKQASVGGPELKLYDAMLSPDRQLIKAGYFVAEGSLVIQQILSLGPSYRLASILSTESQLQKLVGDFVQADAAYSAEDAAGASDGAAPPPCEVFAGGRADVSNATGFKHSALSILAIVRRPAHAHLPLEQWLPTLRPAPGTRRPTLLVLDGVIKPENVGALFRTALAFGVCGVVLSPGCADPLYRKAIRASMGGCFKLPYLHAPSWPRELTELKGGASAGGGDGGESIPGYKLFALHLQGSVAHDLAIADASGAGVDGGIGGGSPAPIAVMVGAEYEGVSDAAAELADVRVRIPMSDAMEGSLDSLNVNVAAAIVLERVFAGNRTDRP